MDLQESFRAPFLQMAWQRHERIVELLGRGDPPSVRSAGSELHCLSGEASMLDFKIVAELARVGELAAREGDRERLVALVEDLRAAIAAVEKAGSS